MADPRWYFDFVSPFSYLQWRKLRPLLATHRIVPVPIVFGAVLASMAHKGPAEIERKREFTYRHVLWRAQAEGTPLRFPPAHPFNPLHALRLCVAAGTTPAAIDALFDWVWRDGREAGSVEAIAPVAAALGVPLAAVGSDATKAALRANTDAAIAAGVFGVPTLAIGDALLWGNDAHDLAVAALADPGLLDRGEMGRAAALPVGVRRG